MITACCARALQKCTDRLYMGFLFIFQAVWPIGNTRNQLCVIANDRMKPDSGYFCPTPENVK